MAELLEQIQQLTPTQQLALIGEIARGLEQRAEDDDDLSPEQRAELEESSRAANANPREGSDWPTVRARLLSTP